MTTKIDVDKLDEHILSLNNLKNSWSNKTYKAVDKDDNCGLSVEAIEGANDTLDKMKNSFVNLITNTVLYMEQRKNSVVTKENTATETISK